MKKIGVVLSLLVALSASAFALNTEVSDKNCTGQKAAFEKYAANQRTDFVVQHILIDMADPMLQMGDEQAQPLAVCYATYQVKGMSFTQFIRDNAGVFPGDIYGKEKTELLAFADRVEFLSEKAAFDRVVALNNDSFTVQYILGNMADPMKTMTDAQARPKAKAYAALQVHGVPFVEFVRQHANDYTANVEIDMDGFADRVEKLAK